MGIFSDIIEPLKNGSIGFMPSDTIYGLSCLALNEEAVERIHNMKGRDRDKPFIILLADSDQAEQLGIDPKDLEAARPHWPAPLTVIAPAGPLTPQYLHRGKNSLAVRVPDYKELRDLLAKTGPLVSTSANLQGKEPAKSAAEAKDYFGDKLDFYIDAGELSGQPSTIAMARNGELEVLRQGAFIVKE